jgi:hypothetical protein
MAKKEEEKTTEETEVQEVAGADQQAARKIQVDDRGVDLEASDYWHMSGTPEEVVIRFGSTKQSQQGGPVKVTHRMAVSYFTAKRLVSALGQTIKRYEDALNSMDKQQAAGE